MAISENKIYPRTGDAQTVYLKNVITNDNIKIGDYQCTTILCMTHGNLKKIMCYIIIRLMATGCKLVSSVLSLAEQSFCLPVQFMRCVPFQHIHFQYFLRSGDWR